MNYNAKQEDPTVQKKRSESLLKEFIVNTLKRIIMANPTKRYLKLTRKIEEYEYNS